jgi:hypothetical protein
MTRDLEGAIGHQKPDLSEAVKELGIWDPKGIVAVIDTKQVSICPACLT